MMISKKKSVQDRTVRVGVAGHQNHKPWPKHKMLSTLKVTAQFENLGPKKKDAHSISWGSTFFAKQGKMALKSGVSKRLFRVPKAQAQTVQLPHEHCLTLENFQPTKHHKAVFNRLHQFTSIFKQV